MKLHFESDLDFQLQAIEAVCDIFRGQEVCRTEFTVTRASSELQGHLDYMEYARGIGNRMALSEEAVFENLKAVQLRNGIAPSDTLRSSDFTVEMETGTGKTYVYLRTILELNKRYGFTKFIIVVPSVAIKEGVYKTLQITAPHYRSLYAGTVFEYHIYDSSKLGQVRNFVSSPQVQIMILTVGAMNRKAVNNLYKKSEDTEGERPIDFIKATNPILIVDEPQSVDGGLKGRGREALSAMEPLCTLRYSATHIDRHHMIYRLDAVDAHERKLVKQIEVASAMVEYTHNLPYIRLLSTSSRREVVSAKVELDIEVSGKVYRKEVTVQDGDDLELTTSRAIYRNHHIGEIRAEKGNEFVELRVPGEERYLRRGEAWADVDSSTVHRGMIRRTIREHLEKEKRLRPKGIKVLSLFFIDAVDKYRQYDDSGNPVKGEYALMFEEEYRRLINHPDYRTAEIDRSVPTEVHDGYFSIDKRGGWIDTTENNKMNRDNAERAYSLIMKDKEKLLSFKTPLKFIFSHSALREGWDNPNIFQICALRDIRTERERRQTIGRGLRLCVNQKGERLKGFEMNTLTVIATESYEKFAENLQREIEDDTGVRFGVVMAHQFAAIPIVENSGQKYSLGFEASKTIWNNLKAGGFIDSEGKVLDKLRDALFKGTLKVPEEFIPQRDQVIKILHKLSGSLEIKNADERRIVRPRQAVLFSSDFKSLWDRVKHKTVYRVSFDNQRLIEECVTNIMQAPAIPKAQLRWRKAGITIDHSGVGTTEGESFSTVLSEDKNLFLPDIMTELQNRTQLTRRSIQQILCNCKRLNDFKRNPQKFLEMADLVIQRCKQHVLVDGIKYQRLGDEFYYAQELFEERELVGYLKHMRSATKSVYEQVVYESEVESRFADGLEKNTAVKIYTKLPSWFKIPTPLGGYSPDWAVLVESEDGERLYFVVETKGSLMPGDLRRIEEAKIKCGQAHFDALKVGTSPAQFQLATDADAFFDSIGVAD